MDRSPGGSDTLSIFVADGAGSAAHGGLGADAAIEAAALYLQAQLTRPEFCLSDSFAVECVVAIRERLYSMAANAGLVARDYACTFLGVVSSSQGTLAFQIGDGAIVLDVGNGLEVPIVPMAGEYANMTYFVTDEDAIRVLVSKVFDRPVGRVAVFSDGLQRLAMNMAANTAHEPFFAPFFATLANTTIDQDEQLRAALVGFLDSPAVNERTDDDKTLALAVFAP